MDSEELNRRIDLSPTWKLTKLTELNLGGGEGKKFRAEFEKEGKVIQLFAKEDNDKEYILGTIRSYRLAQKVGLPVPKTTRYLLHDGKHYLLMSNLQPNDEYSISAINDSPNQPNTDPFQNINLDETERDRLILQCKLYSQIASENGLILWEHNYGIRNNLISGKFDIVILDLDPESICPNSNTLKETNSESCQKFIDKFNH